MPKDRVVVILKDTFHGEGNELFIRYAVRNGTQEAYTLSTPQVIAINLERFFSWLGSPVELPVEGVRGRADQSQQ